MNTELAILHRFEAAHRLPELGGKAVNLHGHSWQVEITLTSSPPDTGVVVNYGHLQDLARGWIDEWLDHGTMLGANDPLTEVLESVGCKVFVFGVDNRTDDRWPTVGAVARAIAAESEHLFRDHPVAVTGVRVDETHLTRARVHA